MYNVIKYCAACKLIIYLHVSYVKSRAVCDYVYLTYSIFMFYNIDTFQVMPVTDVSAT